MYLFQLTVDSSESVCLFRFIIRIKLASTDLRIEKETYVYPTISFIGELGGSLGLFVGFSFLTVFDFFDFIEKLVISMKNNY